MRSWFFFSFVKFLSTFHQNRIKNDERHDIFGQLSGCIEGDDKKSNLFGLIGVCLQMFYIPRTAASPSHTAWRVVLFAAASIRCHNV